MTFDELMRRAGPFKKESRPSPEFLYDLRYRGHVSFYEIEGSIEAQIDTYEKVPTAWDRLSWDDPWEPPKKPTNIPMIYRPFYTNGFNDAANPMNWLLRIGIAMQRGISLNNPLVSKLNRTWEALAKANRMLSDPPWALNASAAFKFTTELQTAWFDYVDYVIEATQHDLKCDEPPMVVVVGRDLGCYPRMADELELALKSTGHPRLLCLYERLLPSLPLPFPEPADRLAQMGGVVDESLVDTGSNPQRF